MIGSQLHSIPKIMPCPITKDTGNFTQANQDSLGANLSCLCNSLSFPFIRFLCQVDVPIEVPEEIDDMSATVHDEDGNLVRSTLNLEPDGLYHVRYVAKQRIQQFASAIFHSDQS